ncbi:hypothetical protein GOODEAATRI_008754, partial [Goodea atripinnis]
PCRAAEGSAVGPATSWSSPVSSYTWSGPDSCCWPSPGSTSGRGNWSYCCAQCSSTGWSDQKHQCGHSHSGWDTHSSGGTAEDHLTAGGDARHADPVTESAQPCPSTFCYGVPWTAARPGPAAHQESSSARGRQGQNARQAQWGEQL